MGTEIGARDFGDPGRYDMLEVSSHASKYRCNGRDDDSLSLRIKFLRYVMWL